MRLLRRAGQGNVILSGITVRLAQLPSRFGDAIFIKGLLYAASAHGTDLVLVYESVFVNPNLWS